MARPVPSAQKSKARSKRAPGRGGRRKGFASANEIQDMRLFDGIPDKEPSQGDGKPPARLEDEFETRPPGP